MARSRPAAALSSQGGPNAASQWQIGRERGKYLPMNLRENIQVVLVTPRFPENIGMAARACGNMGVNRLALVNPELWPEASCGRAGETPEASSPYLEKALSLATSAGRGIVENVKVFNSLAAALSGSSLSIGATARTGGWRQGILTPAQAAELVKAHLEKGGSAAFVFGPEDKGLDNEAVEQCSHLVTIPTASEPSLNLAQAVLLLLYELSRALPFSTGEKPPRPGRVRHSPPITMMQQDLLIEKVKAAMLALESLPSDNSSYFMLPIRRLIARSEIRHNEFSMLMGICSKILKLADINKKPEL